MRRAFTLIELLIVIGLLGALAAMVMLNLQIDRKQVIEDSVVVKELADIQAAFQTFAGDVSFNSHRLENCQLVAEYELSVLLENDDDNFAEWNHEKQIGWNGPYLMAEGRRVFNIDNKNQELSVIETPESVNESDGHYYRVIATDEDGDVVSADSSEIKQLWVVYPFWGSGDFPYPNVNLVNDQQKKLMRELL
ncbi:MAG: type II secretion system GspH family protein [Planctomycetaceae bacterium]|jgi:prepilin-type N-terminal cleavage/methylation domain-containing protein|nr:type II secretion system GspH family protein [Planctomycetaceae bacterium]